MTAIPQRKRVGLRQDKAQRWTQSPTTGSDDVFRQLVTDHQQSVRVFISRCVHCSQQVEDLAQEVFIAAYQQSSQFRCESTVSTWLLGIARNKALHFIRTEMRRQHHRQQFAVAESLQRLLVSLERFL
jgi:RNA polymerase sigma-70 factor (ECF subfamily)